MRADERDDWDWKYENHRDMKEIANMDAQEKLKARNTFECMVRRLQYALDEQAELKRHDKTMEPGLYALKAKRVELCVKSARKAMEAAKTEYERVCK